MTVQVPLERVPMTAPAALVALMPFPTATHEPATGQVTACEEELRDTV